MASRVSRLGVGVLAVGLLLLATGPVRAGALSLHNSAAYRLRVLSRERDS